MARQSLAKLSTILLAAVACSCAPAQGTPKSTDNKTNVAIWYDAFNTKNPALVDEILGADWVDLPPAPGQNPGRQGAKEILTELTTAFPDLKLTIRDILQDGDKVVVRSEITGTQSGTFMGFPAKNRRISIQAIDIHQFAKGKIVRSWHTEDWMTAFRQLEVLHP